MSYRTELLEVVCAATAGQVLPKKVAMVLGAVQFSATAGEGAELTPTVGAPTAAEIQFTGAPGASSNAVTLNAAPVAGIVLLVRAVPEGGAQAAA